MSAFETAFDQVRQITHADAEENSLSSLSLVKKAMSRLNAGQVEEFSTLFSRKMTYRCPGGPVEELTDRDAFRDHITARNEEFETGPGLMIERVIPATDRVIVEANSDALTRRGEVYENHHCFIFHVRDGLIRELVEFCDPAKAAAVTRD